MAGSGHRIAIWAALCLALCIAAPTVRAQAPVYGKTVKVGDSTGWTYINASTGQPADYEAWAKQQVFFVNDILEFNYEPNKQNLYSFDSFEGWTSCNLSAAQLLDNGTNGFSQWYLPFEGYYDFASGIYCSKGQKFRIYAVNASSIPFDSPSIDAPSPNSGPSPNMAPAPSSGGDLPPDSQLPPSMTGPTGARVPNPAPPSASAPATWKQTLLLLFVGIAACVAAAVVQ
ncbi:hypothetical protein MPTK1_4g01510 [Marchantia polymorpha subsp. ruderalis]|uniref:Phytocyanin domain-containing protein n=2 Tax=Marchantia polymorpha TaxID=3197 RepID=A0AAF6B572_MARPO|nr:hypothetical protein MARPO_0098s0049 [Marchantia polymorpha]PTQ32503.1 hypothetical protein MARPO_0098s0049 [Marchantia polymorpha]BBN07156.1 hypothetical protein Mp_4g01510 [Marchantia polymorpha subsp. ruderalis]BBN07157.1 hypothetical protein Mp_4g01510 [Marchantia polymorpha subsp. ruderalis]|eukprot:PTQ32502.1 hypothetical protein MARPO_0098s0049 [Marchantia polymorpha]